ncbi:hypothetical protein GGQ84_002480 [Desulfitispora alkaliphila]|uniref:hypothetical protein n=1 Tax=Desulfitispora alkaliphila TaxID=622674 RepID=UPI003D1E0533
MLNKKFTFATVLLLISFITLGCATLKEEVAPLYLTGESENWQGEYTINSNSSYFILNYIGESKNNIKKVNTSLKAPLRRGLVLHFII